jgi:hypothetical protein
MAGIPNPLVNPANPGSWSSDPTANAQGGAAAQYSNSSATTAASTETVTLTTSGTIRNKYYATLTLANPLNAAIETKINVTGIEPTGYRGTDLMITGISDTFPYSVTYEVPSALGSQTVAGTVLVAGTRFNTGDYGMVKTGRTALMTDRNRENVESFYQNSQETDLDAKKAALFAGLNPNLPFPIAIIEAVAKALLREGYDLVVGVITTVEQAAYWMGQIINKVVDWIGEAIDAAGKLVGDIATAVVDGAGNLVEDFLDVLHWVFTGGPFEAFQKLLTGHKTLDDVKDKAVELKTSVYQTEVESGTTTDFFNTVRVLPTWVGGKTDDVNLPQSFISGTSTTVATSPSILGLDGRLVLIPVVAGQNRTWSAVKFGVAQMALNAKVPGTQYFYGTPDVPGNYLTSASTATLPVVAPATVGLVQATIGLPRPSYVDVGDTITVSGFPTSWAGYNGTSWTVSAKSDVVPYSVSYIVPALLPTATPTTQTYTATTTATSGNGTTATVTFNSSIGTLSVGESVLISGVTPTAYNGQKTITARSNNPPYSVSFSSTATGSMTVAGSVGTDPVLTTATLPSYMPPSVTTPSAVLMGVYDVDETTGAATKVIDLGNVRSKINVGANSQRNLQVISLPSPKPVQMGEIYYIGILQIGDAGLTPAGSIALSHASSSTIPYTFNTGTFPKRVCLYYNSGTLGVLPATFTDAQTSGSSSNFWGAFGDDVPNVIQPPVAFADSFTGTSGAVIDTQKWLTRYGNGLRIASGLGGELRATANSTNGTSINTYKFKTNYLKQTAQCTIVTQTENLGRLGVGGSIITLRGDGSGKFIYLRVVIEVYGLSWRLKVGIYTSLTYSQPGTQLSGGTLRKEVLIGTGLNPSNGNTWKFIADGYTYVGYRNGVEVIRWADTGFAFAGSGVGNANFKEVGIGAFYVSEYSCVDNWTAFDESA